MSMLPRLQMVIASAFVFGIVCGNAAPGAEPTAEVRVRLPLIYIDDVATVSAPALPAEVAYEVRTITRNGWGATTSGRAKTDGGTFQVKPLVEGIHVVTFGEANTEVRFLAMDLPATLDVATLGARLPLSSKKLLDGGDYTIVAMGDSVTATGDYPEILAMMLRRGTGNDRVRVVKRGYPGRSVDAAVRFFPDDAVAARPDLGVLMYGLNDQAAGASLDAYLEQCEYIAEHLASDCGADALLLQPTPDYAIPTDAASRTPQSNPPQYAIRTIGWAESLRDLGVDLKVPVGETFDALWGHRGRTIEESAIDAWPLYPTNYAKPFSSLRETAGKGDTIHPNALGHLAIARAAYAALALPPKESEGLKFEVTSHWTAHGVRTRLVATNVSTGSLRGTLVPQPPSGVEFSTTAPAAYDLVAGESVELAVDWLQVKRPADLLTYPGNVYLAPGRPRLPVVDVRTNGSSRVHAPLARFANAASFTRERMVVSDVAEVMLNSAGPQRVVRVAIPPDRAVGRIPLVEEVKDPTGASTWAVAEVAYVRFARATLGEATVDGDLGEWNDAERFPVGEPVQARSTSGIVDQRASPQECYLNWAIRAGHDALHLSADVAGTIDRDRFVVFLDPRPPEQLGTAGRYYWVDGAIEADGKVRLGRGETSKLDAGLQGSWKPKPGGAVLEVSIPYALMEQRSWPSNGDLGLSIQWFHTGPTGLKTTLSWSEDGHPWSPRWYGVARIDNGEAPKSALPYMVRVK